MLSYLLNCYGRDKDNKCYVNKELPDVRECSLCNKVIYIDIKRKYQSICHDCYKRYPELKIFFVGTLPTFCNPKDLIAT